MRRLISVLATLALLAVSCGGDAAEDKFGQELYEATCAVCHRSDGGGTAAFPAVGAGSDSVSLTDEQLAGVVRAGPGTMPGFSGRFTDAQVDSVVDYLRELQVAAD